MNIGINQTLKTIAKSNNITIDVVKYEIEHAIASARSNPEPKIKEFWCNFNSKNKEPSAQEIILYIINKFITEDYNSI